MKLKYTALALIMFYYGRVASQSTMGGVASEGVEMNTRAAGMVTEIPMEEPITIGNSYLYDEWYSGKIILKNGQVINHLPIKFDLRNDYFELKTENGVKALNGRQVKSFKLDNECPECFYINRSEFRFDDKIINGFIKYIYGNGEKYSLYEGYSIKLISAQYNAALDLGDRNNKIVKRSNYVIIKGTETFIVEKSIRRFANKFDNKDEIYSFLKDNKLNLKNIDHLKLTLDFLNTH